MNNPKKHSLKFSLKNLFLKKFAPFAFLFCFYIMNGQNEVHINIPNFDDSYCKAVKAIEAGITTIDYKKFRENFIKSDQFKITYKSRTKMSNLKRRLYENKFHSRNDSIIFLSKKILSLDYTDLSIHKTLEQTYSKLNDTINANKHKTIQTGLLKSIIDNRDGKSCATAWSIVNVSEQYFILDSLNCTVVKQETNTNNGICYKVIADENGFEKIYHFEATKIAEAQKNIRTY